MPIMKETNLFDIDPVTGEKIPVASHTTFRGSQFGDDYIMLKLKAINKLLESDASGVTIKIYLKLLSMQNFGDKIVATNKYLIDELKVSRKSFYSSIKWLENNQFIQKCDEQGMNAYLLNPEFTARGTAAIKSRKHLWSMNFKAN